MPVLNVSGITDDPWVTLNDDEAIPAGRSVIVPWDRIAADGGQALDGRDPRGVIVPSDFDAAKLLPLIARLGLIAVRPANFKDGRAFSIGRLVRQRFGFNGDLRVVGDFIPDQVPFYVRCGFTSFDTPPGFDTAAALKLLEIFPFNYQAGLADRPIAALRHGAAVQAR